MEFAIGKARALNDWLEITGEQSLNLAQTGNAHGSKVLFEEGASGVRILRPQPYGFAAGIPQPTIDRSVVVGTPYFVQRLAAVLIGCECGEVIIGRPARKIGPVDRLELAAGEFQRFFGQCSVGRQT
jgi:hypothetical protein